MASNIVHYNHWASKQSTPSTFEHWNDYKQASNPDSLIAKLWKSWRCTPLKMHPWSSNWTSLEWALKRLIPLRLEVGLISGNCCKWTANALQRLSDFLQSALQPALQSAGFDTAFKAGGFKPLGSTIESPLEAPLLEGPFQPLTISLIISTWNAQTIENKVNWTAGTPES